MTEFHQPLHLTILTIVVAITILDTFTVAASATTIATTTIIPPPPPISLPVYSLSTPIPHNLLTAPPHCEEEDDDRNTRAGTISTSMNIVTFANAASVAAPKLWIVSLYRDTLTKDSFLKSGVGVLQLLDKSQKDLVPILGKRSGYDYPGFDKRNECDSVGFGWVGGSDTRAFVRAEEDADGDGSDDVDDGDTRRDDGDDDLFGSMELLPRCRSYIKIKLVRTIEAGDHEVALCQVVGVGVWDDGLRRVITNTAQGQQPPMDEKVVLYTGYLREEGII